MITVQVDKIGSAASRLNLAKSLTIGEEERKPVVGDVVVVRAEGESLTYGNLELADGRLARIARGDILVGVLGNRRALKGFVGEVPARIKRGDSLHLLNMGGLVGDCRGHHSSLSDAIPVELLGYVCDAVGEPVNIGDAAVRPEDSLEPSAPLIVVAGTCMNSGKTVAATEIIKQARNAGFKVAGAKLTGVACLRDTLNMEDHGAFATVSFLDCGLPSTVDVDRLADYAKGLLNGLNQLQPDLIVVELGDGIVGGYSVDSILKDAEIRAATSSFVFCAADYVGVIGGAAVLKEIGITIDLVAGSVTDSPMGEEFVREHLGLEAGNARRDGRRLFDLLRSSLVQTSVMELAV
jgi:hypothetical protein